MRTVNRNLKRGPYINYVTQEGRGGPGSTDSVPMLLKGGTRKLRFLRYVIYGRPKKISNFDKFHGFHELSPSSKNTKRPSGSKLRIKFPPQPRSNP